MTATTQNANIYSTPRQADYDYFEKAVRVLGEPEELENGFIAFGNCSTSHLTVDYFEYATRETKDVTPATITTGGVKRNRLVPSMLVLGQIGSAIRKVVAGKVTDLRVHFAGLVRVGDDLQIEVKGDVSNNIESHARVYFFARVRGKVVAEGDANIDTGTVGTAPINPFFAAGLFSTVIDTKLPGPGSSVRDLDITFDGKFHPGMTVRTVGALHYVEKCTGAQHLDLFLMGAFGIVAYAAANVEPAKVR